MDDDFLGSMVGDDLEERYRRLRGEGSATSAMLQSDINRGVLPGNKNEETDPTSAARLDRYAWGAQAGLGGVPIAAGYEGIKALGQSPLLSGIAGSLFGDTGKKFFQTDKTTSPASMSNIGAYIQGALRDKPSFLGYLLGE